jgi:hypothetical protein
MWLVLCQTTTDSETNGLRLSQPSVVFQIRYYAPGYLPDSEFVVVFRSRERLAHELRGWFV